MRSLTMIVRDLDRRFAAALMVVPMAACGGTARDPNDGSVDPDVITGCNPYMQNCCPPPTTINYTACAMDASADASDAAVDGAACFSGCMGACQAQNIYGFCTEQGEDAGQRTAQCARGCGVGRRPTGLLDERASPGVAGWLAHAAWLEAASVRAFVRLARELEAHGAPRWLIRAAKRAARDEVRHAKAMAAFARKHGSRVARVRVRERGVRSLEAIARENAVEGCVGETFGALVARWQSEHAMSPDVRAVMRRIAPDERRHAALSLAVDAWIQPQLPHPAAARVDRARRRAAQEITAHQGQIVSQQTIELGLPGPEQGSAMAKILFA